MRWSWRDYRARWLQVVAIALIIAIGTGVYAGLTSNTAWRRASYPASYEALASHDLTAITAEGTFAAQGELVAVVDAMDHPEWVVDAEERLVVPTQVDAREVADGALLVPGRVVGVDVGGGGPHVDRLRSVGGRSLTAADDGTPVVVLDSHFADHHDLPVEGTIELSGGPVDYVGTGYTPEYFAITGEQGSFLAEAGFGVMFAPLATAQALSGNEGQVNQLAVILDDGVDPQEAIAELEAALAVAAPDVAAEVGWLEDERLYRRLFDDIDSDQQLFNVFAALILGGAAFAAFNLTGRIVEAQRREIGIGMALGLDRWGLAARPLLVALQIALLGVIFGVAVGLWVGSALSDLNQEFLPLPVWDDSFQPGVFLRGASLGLALTFLAAVYPVWRAVGVDPIDAIQTRRGLTRTGGLAPLLRRVPLPGNTISEFPFRDVVRSPRRTLLTTLGIAAAIAVLVALVGMIDSFVSTVERGEDEILGASPERATVTLDTFHPEDAEQVAAVEAAEGVAVAEPTTNVGGVLIGGDEEIDAFISLVDLDSETWTPTAVEGTLASDEPSVVISEKAADDLGVSVGEDVTLRHPRREGVGYSFVETDVPVGAIHANPYRFVVYMDRDHADLMGLSGLANAVSVVPEDGLGSDDLKVSLFGRPGVAAVEGVSEVAATIRDTIQELFGFLRVVQAFVLVLALLIAFNSTAISSDERRRDHATMFAFGLPTRTVLGLTVVESLVIGVLGTGAGILLGRLLLAWMVQVLLPQTVPDLALDVDVAASTYLTAAVLGVVAVALAPVLLVRRLRRMDIPATLRVVE